MRELDTLDITSMLPATLTAPGMTEEQFVAFCQLLPDTFVEYTSDGILSLTGPTNPDGAVCVMEVMIQLGNWEQTNHHGFVCGPDVGFLLPDGARRSPDACWFDTVRWEAAKTPGKRFPVFAPEFVIEVRSPGDRLPPLQAKMEEYIANGVQLGWLIDELTRSVTIYRPQQAPQTLDNPAVVNGEDPVDEFVLSLDRIFT